MSRMERYFYGNGGPIILVQIENEYGSFGCDMVYKKWLTNETLSYVKNNAVLFTNDGPIQVKCGKIPDVLATLDFGYSSSEELSSYWKLLREQQPTGPLVVTEYYTGWITHWSESMSKVSTDSVAKTLM